MPSCAALSALLLMVSHDVDGRRSAEPPVDLSKWSPEYVRSIAGTQDFDTAGDCGKVTPLDYKGRLTFWYQGVFEGDPDLLRQYYKRLLRDVPQDLSEHPARGAGPHL